MYRVTALIIKFSFLMSLIYAERPTQVFDLNLSLNRISISLSSKFVAFIEHFKLLLP